MLKEIEIKDEAQVEKINRIFLKNSCNLHSCKGFNLCNAPYEVWLCSGSMMLDARSLLGLFAMVGRKAHVVVEDDVAPRSFQLQFPACKPSNQKHSSAYWGHI